MADVAKRVFLTLSSEEYRVIEEYKERHCLNKDATVIKMLALQNAKADEERAKLAKKQGYEQVTLPL